MNSRKIIAFALCCTMLISFVTITSSARSISYDEWIEYYSTCDNKKIILTPGRDETELNFAWHSVWGWTTAKPIVRMSKNADMKDYVEFVGYYTFSDHFNQRTNNVTATGLEENTTYYYTYGVDGVFSEPVKYQTHSFDSFKFLYVSDLQPKEETQNIDSYEWNRTLEAAFEANDDISFILNGGDITSEGIANDEWHAALAPEYLRSYPMAATQGNHDHDGFKTTFKYYFNNPNVFLGTMPVLSGNGYWFRYGDVLFVMVNSAKINFYDNYCLIKEAVEANPDSKWRIAVTHFALYGTSKRAYEKDTPIARDTLTPVFEKYDFDMVLTGHEHVYSRTYFMDNTTKVLQTPGYDTGVVTDPEGVMYLTASGAGGNTRNYPDKICHYDWTSKYICTDNDFYSTIEITDSGSLKLVTVDKITKEVVDTFEIIKTNFEVKEKETDGGYLEIVLRPLVGEYYVIFEMIGDLVNKISSWFTKQVDCC